jgi:hypothetical protein
MKNDNSNNGNENDIENNIKPIICGNNMKNNKQ